MIPNVNYHIPLIIFYNETQPSFLLVFYVCVIAFWWPLNR